MLRPAIYHGVFILHIISAMVGIGTVTVLDYLHIVGLRDRRVERKLFFVYKHLSHLIHAALAVIITTGIVLLYHHPQYLGDPYFQLKMGLLGVVIVNGSYLRGRVYPHLHRCVMEGKRCSQNLLFTSSLSGSISIVSWYAIPISFLTKEFAYSIPEFLVVYGVVLVTTFLVAFLVEYQARRWSRQ